MNSWICHAMAFRAWTAFSSWSKDGAPGPFVVLMLTLTDLPRSCGVAPAASVFVVVPLIWFVDPFVALLIWFVDPSARAGPAGILVALSIADDVTLVTSRAMNWSMLSSPLFLRMLLVMLTTTASIGISASKVAYARADARAGQRLRVKLLQISSKKCAHFSSFESSVCDASALSSHNAFTPSQILWNLLNFIAMAVWQTLTEQTAKSNGVNW